MSRRCVLCDKVGLARRNTSGACVDCHRKLPIQLKRGALRLEDVITRHAAQVLAHLTRIDDPIEARHSRAAQILGVDLVRLKAILEGPAANDDVESVDA